MDVCCMVVQTSDGLTIRKAFDAFAAMEAEARSHPEERVLYWWCETNEIPYVWRKNND